VKKQHRSKNNIFVKRTNKAKKTNEIIAAQTISHTAVGGSDGFEAVLVLVPKSEARVSTASEVKVR
jgi:hypothetical protein